MSDRTKTKKVLNTRGLYLEYLTQDIDRAIPVSGWDKGVKWVEVDIEEGSLTRKRPARIYRYGR